MRSIRYALNLALFFAALAQPFIPETSAKITRALADNESVLSWPMALTDALKLGSTIRAPDVLVAKIEDTQIAEWTERFAGRGNRN